MMDAQFLTLVQHSGSHELLHELSSVVQDMKEEVDMWADLQGKLTLFSQAAVKSNDLHKTGKSKIGSKLDEKTSSRSNAIKASMLVAGYSVEEIQF